MKTRTMTRTQAELLLAAVIIARSTSYVLTKVGLQDMGKFTLLAVRFLLAFAFLAVLFWRRLLQIDRRTLLSGLAMGGIYFCVMTAELTALKTVETSTVSFVTNTAVVIVPLIQAALSRRGTGIICAATPAAVSARQVSRADRCVWNVAMYAVISSASDGCRDPPARR